jgi:hypothetical protein
MTHGRTRCRTLVLATALTIVVGGFAAAVRAAGPAYDLCIQRSPADAGDVMPGTGTHRVTANSTITLTADAQPGYRFAYWLGDVSDPSSEHTTILVNEPKMVVAVFQHEPNKRLDEEIAASGAGGGGGGGMLADTAVDLRIPGSISPGGGAKGETKVVPVIVPVVIPEPGTVALLGLGMFGVCIRKRLAPVWQKHLGVYVL